MLCSIGKVCNWDTVDDSAQSHMSKENIRLVLRQTHLNSKGFLSDSPKDRESTTSMLWNPRCLRFDHKDELKKRHGKVWLALR